MATAERFDLALDEHRVRADIAAAFRAARDHIAAPGPGWTGAQRVAIAWESRAAWDCDLCTRRKAALSPNAIAESHAGCEELTEVAVDTVHRMTTDSGRLTESWFNGVIEAGLSDVQYAEIIGIVGTVTSIDTFYRALGLPLEPLPQPMPGAATGYRPERLKQGGGWLPMLMERNLAPAEKDIYGGMKQGANVLRCMSLAPDEVRNLLRISEAMYLSDRDVVNFSADGGRAISRDQIELLAARVSVLNDCFY